ncbi:ketopantoate reductase family protein [Propioniciclava soli]|uniref:2-dehydropantoate 2-reductase n=1 Tax=Propioniciclava soli TaxID=2775081 RepID=A0ABZ3C609_9ACTN|nr:2-dehydropantoate 2-reductase [Propioniciclava soli]
MKFLFLGAGAIGTYIGGSLAASGQTVAFVEQPATAAVIRERGLRVTTAGGVRAVDTVTVYDSPADALAAGPHDVAVVALKSFDTADAIDSLVATGASLPAILSLQNGVDNEATIAARVGASGVIAGTVVSAVGKPGVGEAVEEKHRGMGVALGHPLSDRLVAALDGAGLACRGFADADAMKWSKLLTNLTGNATSAILDLPVAALFSDADLYRVEVEVLRECLRVMRAMGLRPVDLPGTPVRLLALAAQRLPRVIAQPALTRALGSGRGDKMPSFHIDLHSGRGRSEVEFLNGAVVRHGAAHGVPTPVNEVLTRTLLALTDGTESIERFRHRPAELLALLP